MPKTVFIIVGPTASGKTALSIELASHFETAIISADSRQCFCELNIGVAKPSAAQLQLIKHYFINSHSIHDEVNAASYEKLSLEYAAEIFKNHDVAVMVGGTGLYIKAFCEGLDDIPPTNPSIRKKIIENFEQQGIDWLQKEISTADPDFFATGEIQNPQRTIRALEVKLATGKSILSFQSKEKKQRPFRIIKIGLDLPRAELYNNINKRVDSMIEEGLIEEAKSLYSLRHLNALQTVGYSELFDFFENKSSAKEAIDKIKQNTRHYAKRQLTWFRKDASTKWFHPSESRSVIAFANTSLTSD